jgi:hypothetical protein
MADIEKLIQDLKSDNPGKRYKACNELFNEQSIPEIAIEALSRASQDSDPLIANAAHRALGVHTEITIIPDYQFENKYKPTPMTGLESLVMVVWAGIVAVITFFVTLILSINNPFIETTNDGLEIFPACIVVFLPTAFLTAFVVFGTLLSKWNTPGSEIRKGKVVLISTIFGMISGIVVQLVLLLLLGLIGGIALKP